MDVLAMANPTALLYHHILVTTISVIGDSGNQQSREAPFDVNYTNDPP